MATSDWAKREVELACKHENPDRKEDTWDYGCACYESALKAYLSLCEDGHSGMSFSFTRDILIRLLNSLPLTPIEDIPESWVHVYDTDDGEPVYQCNRMSRLFKTVHSDGSVSFDDNNYTCTDLVSGWNYSGGGAHDILKRYIPPITFPYYPKLGKYKIVTEEYLTDRKNGDFDTKAYLWIETPDKVRIEVNEYYAEVDREWKQISKEEFDERVGMHNKREAEEELRS